MVFNIRIQASVLRQFYQHVSLTSKWPSSRLSIHPILSEVAAWTEHHTLKEQLKIVVTKQCETTRNRLRRKIVLACRTLPLDTLTQSRYQRRSIKWNLWTMSRFPLLHQVAATVSITSFAQTPHSFWLRKLGLKSAFKLSQRAPLFEASTTINARVARSHLVPIPLPHKSCQLVLDPPSRPFSRSQTQAL